MVEYGMSESGTSVNGILVQFGQYPPETECHGVIHLKGMKPWDAKNVQLKEVTGYLEMHRDRMFERLEFWIHADDPWEGRLHAHLGRQREAMEEDRRLRGWK